MTKNFMQKQNLMKVFMNYLMNLKRESQSCNFIKQTSWVYNCLCKIIFLKNTISKRFMVKSDIPKKPDPIAAINIAKV